MDKKLDQYIKSQEQLEKLTTQVADLTVGSKVTRKIDDPPSPPSLGNSQFTLFRSKSMNDIDTLDQASELGWRVA